LSASISTVFDIKRNKSLPAPKFSLKCDFTRVRRTDPDFTTTAIHGIDSLRWLLGTDFRSLEFRYRELQDGANPVTVFSAQGFFHNGAGVNLLFQPLSGVPTEHTGVHTSHNTFDLRLNQGPDAPGSLTHWQDGKLLCQVDAAQVCGSDQDFVLSGFYAENAAFLQAVKSGLRCSEHDFASARQSVEIMQSMRERHSNYQSS
jgi:predicted dehydrogenase